VRLYADKNRFAALHKTLMKQPEAAPAGGFLQDVSYFIRTSFIFSPARGRRNFFPKLPAPRPSAVNDRFRPLRKTLFKTAGGWPETA
jgi:hypothetical protein